MSKSSCPILCRSQSTGVYGLQEDNDRATPATKKLVYYICFFSSSFVRLRVLRRCGRLRNEEMAHKVVTIPILEDNYSYLIICMQTKEAACIDPAGESFSNSFSSRCESMLMCSLIFALNALCMYAVVTGAVVDSASPRLQDHSFCRVPALLILFLLVYSKRRQNGHDTDIVRWSYLVFSHTPQRQTLCMNPR